MQIFKENDFINTYRAVDGNQDDVVIKILNGSSFQELKQNKPAASSDIERKFRLLGETLYRCQNRHIVRALTQPFLESDEYNQQWWCIPFAFVQGSSLKDYVQSPLPEDEAIKYIKQIAKGLSEIHSQEILHLNVNPENIIIHNNRDAVLIGFGFINGIRTEHTLPDFKNDDAKFLPIKLFTQNQIPTPRSDVFSLAATLYFVLTKDKPNLPTDRIVSTSNQQKDPLRSAREINSNISHHIDAAILQGMSINGNDRPESIEKWLYLLEMPSQNPPNTFFWINLWNSWIRLSLDKKLAIITAAALAIAGIGALLQGIGVIAPILKPNTTSSPVASPSKSP
ncbi:protein kinase [Nostoc sp. CHAB 5844]|nr:protein kinase [Nostoc sp. CHAB 5844]